MGTVRSVLDANALVSSQLLHTGKVSWLRGYWRQGRIRPFVSRETSAELIRVLAYPKFALSADDQRELLDDHLPCCGSVDLPSRPAAAPECHDPFDRLFFYLALVGEADVLVTVDADILALANAFVVSILSPGSFRRKLLGEEEADD